MNTVYHLLCGVCVCVCVCSAHHFVNCLKTVMMVVMEFVEGGSLSSYLERLRVSYIGG